jgi:hypothetical protein
VILLAATLAASAQARDPSDRTLGTELNRERSENRVERMRDDRSLRDKAQAEQPAPSKKKTGKTAKKPLQLTPAQDQK